MSLDERNQKAYELVGQRIWVAGHRGLVGHALLRRLARENCMILTCNREQVDLPPRVETKNGWQQIDLK